MIPKINSPKPQRIAVVDTKIMVKGCKVLIGCPNLQHAQKVASEFGGFMAYAAERAKQVNMEDLYNAHLPVLSRMQADMESI